MKDRIEKEVTVHVYSRGRRHSAEATVTAVYRHRSSGHRWEWPPIVSNGQVYKYDHWLSRRELRAAYSWSHALNGEETVVEKAKERPVSTIENPGSTFNRLTGAVERHGMIDPRSLK